MNITSKIMRQINQVKPVLKRMVPASVLRCAKKSVLKQITAQIQNVKVVPYDKTAYPHGINLIGPISSATGLGQSFRLLERVIRQCDVAYEIYDYAQDTRNRIDVSEYSELIETELKYSINIWHVNPSQFAEAYASMGQTAFDKKYNIAYWLWELEEFPDEWVPYIQLLDEIWTPSEFISQSIRKKTTKPVYTVPYYVTAETDLTQYSRGYFGLPEEQFLFLMMYDVQSISERKNPDGIISAYKRAFSPEQSSAGLVIKLNSADEKELSGIREKISGYKNIYLINRNMEKKEVNSLIANCDVFVSLHRAEGFGLVLAEAMLNHVPVIATNWSANTEFMNSDVACMVDYDMITLDKDFPPYSKGNRWADPDITDAAKYMKKLLENKDYYRNIAEQGYQYVSYVLSADKVKLIIQNRLQMILKEDK